MSLAVSAVGTHHRGESANEHYLTPFFYKVVDMGRVLRREIGKKPVGQANKEKSWQYRELDCFGKTEEKADDEQGTAGKRQPQDKLERYFEVIRQADSQDETCQD